MEQKSLTMFFFLFLQVQDYVHPPFTGIDNNIAPTFLKKVVNFTVLSPFEFFEPFVLLKNKLTPVFMCLSFNVLLLMIK